MAITLRGTKGSALTHVEMDTNLTSYYVSSSLDGTVLNLFTHGTSSYSATTHSVDLVRFLDNIDIDSQSLSVSGDQLTISNGNTITLPTYSVSAETATGGANVRLTDSNGGVDNVKLASGTNVTVTRTDANTITISSAHPTITAASSVDNSGRTYIQDITLDSNGHVIGITSATETVVDTDTTYTAGTGLNLVGTEFSNAAPDQTVSIAGENITINGTYPNFQLTGSTDTTYSAGTGIGIDSSNIISNTAPDQTVTLEGQHITVNGNYPNFSITGSDQSTDVTLVTSAHDYLSITGQAITLGAIDLTTDVTGKLPAGNIEAIALTTVQTAADETAMLALTTQEGDVVVRTDENKTYMHNGGTAGTMTDFTELATPQTYIHPTQTVTANTSTATPAHGGDFTVIDSVSVNTTGHVTAINTKTVTLPADIDTNTWRPVTAGGNNLADSETLTLEAGTNVTITENGGTVTISSTDTNTTYSTATSSALGLVKLGSNTDQTVAANAVTTTASRTYAIQLNASDQMVVNVPWTDTDTDTNTTYSISAETTTGGANLRLTAGGSGSGNDDVKLASGGATTITRTDANTITISSTDTNTTYSAGADLTLSGTTFNVTSDTAATASTIAKRDGSGELTAVNFVTTSDRRLKSEIEPIKDGLDVVRDIIAFEYVKNGQKEAGFIAQDVQEVLPYAVREGEDGYLKMTDRAILAHLHKAVQQLDERLSAIEEKLG